VIVGTYLVPGLPHLVQRRAQNPGYEKLASAMAGVGQAIRKTGAQRIIYFSTQWLSVLGVSFQGRREISGLHVDENWYEFGDLPANFRVDSGFTLTMANHARDSGFAPQIVDYAGFPIDTGTIVANQLINPSNALESGMVSLHVYASRDDLARLGATIAQAIAADGKKTAVVAVSLLSTNYFTSDIDLREDHIRDPKDDAANNELLDLWHRSKHSDAAKLISENPRGTRLDMGLGAYWWLAGTMGGIAVADGKRRGERKAYGAIHGTGAAVVEFH
jgi:2-aminophenol/2-amino-5-chlorophenol 1,6-dioxygenase subunit alpha